MSNPISQEARRAVDSVQSTGPLTAASFEFMEQQREKLESCRRETLIREAAERFERVVRRRYV